MYVLRSYVVVYINLKACDSIYKGRTLSAHIFGLGLLFVCVIGFGLFRLYEYILIIAH